MMRRSRGVLLIGVLFFLTACSSTTFIYNRLDFLIPWYLKDYVDLKRPQKRSLDELLTPFLAWHRQEELPRYVELLSRVETELEEEIAPEQVEALANEFVLAWERIEKRSLEWMLSLGELLTDDQVAGFVENLWDKQREYEEEYLHRSVEEYHEEAYENLLDSMQDFLGRLDWGQRAMLEEAAGELRRSDATWLAERERWVRRMAEHLQREPGWQQRIRDMLAARDETTSVEYLETYEYNSAVIYAVVARLLNTRSEKQDRRLHKKLADFREDLQTLINQ